MTDWLNASAGQEALRALRDDLARELGEPWHVWTDGSCVYDSPRETATKGGRGYGGWAARVEHDASSFGASLRGRVLVATNVLMEIRAALEGLRLVPPGARVVVHTDSTELVSVYYTWLERRLRARDRRHGRQWVMLASEYARMGDVEFELLGRGARDYRHKACHVAAGQEAKACRDGLPDGETHAKRQLEESRSRAA